MRVKIQCSTLLTVTNYTEDNGKSKVTQKSNKPCITWIDGTKHWWSQQTAASKILPFHLQNKWRWCSNKRLKCMTSDLYFCDVDNKHLLLWPMNEILFFFQPKRQLDPTKPIILHSDKDALLALSKIAEKFSSTLLRIYNLITVLVIKLR